MTVFLVPDALAGERIDVAAARVTGHSRSRIAELIASGGVLLDGEAVGRASRTVAGGSMLELVTDPRPTHAVTRPRLADGLEIIHTRTGTSWWWINQPVSPLTRAWDGKGRRSRSISPRQGWPSPPQVLPNDRAWSHGLTSAHPV